QDGAEVIGPKTMAAFANFEQEKFGQVTGQFDDSRLAMLFFDTVLPQDFKFVGQKIGAPAQGDGFTGSQGGGGSTQAPDAFHSGPADQFAGVAEEARFNSQLLAALQKPNLAPQDIVPLLMQTADPATKQQLAAFLKEKGGADTSIIAQAVGQAGGDA